VPCEPAWMLASRVSSKKDKKISHNRKKIPCFFAALCYSINMKDKETQFNVNGTLCTLVVSEDNDGDCIKLWHELTSVETGECIATLGWSPYSTPSDAEVRQLIGLGEVILGQFHLPDGLRWANSHPLSRFNFDSNMLAAFVAGESRPEAGKLELVFRIPPAPVEVAPII
jgi:hypothetical protein